MERPLDALNQAKNKKVVIDMKNKKQIIGKLLAFDIHPNIVIDEAEEREDGKIVRKLGRVFIRGDMIVTISPA